MPVTESKPLLRKSARPTRPYFSNAYAVHPATVAAFTVDEPPKVTPRMRASGANSRRVLLASPDRRFLENALSKLRGTSILAAVTLEAGKVVRDIARIRPHVLLIADAMLEAEPALTSILPRRFPSLPILVVRSGERGTGDRDWQVLGWGGVGVVAADDLLRRRNLPMVIAELAKQKADGPPTSI